MSRPQFSLTTLLWLMAVVAAFLGGAEAGRRYERRQIDWEHQSMRKELGELRDYQMSNAYIIDGLLRVMKKHSIDKSELDEAIGSQSGTQE